MLERHGVCISHLKIKTNSLHSTSIILTSTIILSNWSSLKQNFSTIIFISSPLIYSSSQSDRPWALAQELKFPHCHIQKTPLCSNLSSQQQLFQMLTCFFMKHLSWLLWQQTLYFPPTVPSHFSVLFFGSFSSMLCHKSEMWALLISLCLSLSLSPPSAPHLPLFLLPSLSVISLVSIMENSDYLLISNKIVFEDLIPLNSRSL